VSIYEIAKRAGVSTATVSYALNNKRKVSKEKKELILKIAEELNYVPNSLAKGLLSKKTNIVGLIVPDLSMPYTLAIIRHLEYFARKNNLYLLLGHTDGQMSTMRSIVDSFISKNVDGIILATGLGVSDYQEIQKVIARIQKYKVPAVMITPMNASAGPKINYVIPDLEDGEYQVTRYLLENGLDRLVFLGGRPSDYVTHIRREGFKRALEDFRIRPHEGLFRDCGYSFQDGYHEMLRYMEDGETLPSAFVAINDSVALGMSKALKEKDIRVPEDVSLVGYDDIELPTLDFIPLTTVKIPVEEVSKLCVEGLMKQWEGQNLTFQYSLKPQVVVRESVKSKYNNV